MSGLNDHIIRADRLDVYLYEELDADTEAMRRLRDYPLEFLIFFIHLRDFASQLSIDFFQFHLQFPFCTKIVLKSLSSIMEIGDRHPFI